MNVIGLCFAFHDSSACLVKDGKLVSAVEEERFNRVKRCLINRELFPTYFNPIFPYKSLEHVVKASGISFEEVDAVAVGISPKDFFRRTVKHGLINSRIFKEKLGFFAMPYYFLRLLHNTKKIIRRIGIDCKVHFVPHQVSHAASSVYCSSFKKTNFVTLDGQGELDSGSTGFFDGELKTLSIIDYFHKGKINSLGDFYTAASQKLGFSFGQEGKFMGLAAYGKPKSYLNRVVKVDGLKYFFQKDFNKVFSNIVKSKGVKKFHADFAVTVQRVLDETVRKLVENLYDQTGYKNLCLAGGVALNCNMNSYLLDQDFVENIFIQPGASDQGTAVGAALHCYKKLTGKNPEFKMEHAYLGPGFTDEQIKKSLDGAGLSYRKCNPAIKGAELISQGKVIGWFQGGLEFGPRALGNRSILADPRSKKVRDKVNQIKAREFWRPLSPSVLHEKGGDYFEDYVYSPFMTLTFNVKKGKQEEVAGITHVDGTSRLQSVKKTFNPLFYSLISKFHGRTSVPMVLNTSFNKRGEPLVCTPEDAIRTFYSTGLDYMIIGDYLVSK
ncbi:MAG: hypothetical protein GOU97_03260 [Nanoarchaeota archaeon]|nr:hypothetical protein [Nanoarchaeota archaeon]